MDKPCSPPSLANKPTALPPQLSEVEVAANPRAINDACWGASILSTLQGVHYTIRYSTRRTLLTAHHSLHWKRGRMSCLSAFPSLCPCTISPRPKLLRSVVFASVESPSTSKGNLVSSTIGMSSWHTCQLILSDGVWFWFWLRPKVLEV